MSIIIIAIFIMMMKLIFGVYNRVYLLVTFDNNRFTRMRVPRIIPDGSNQIWNQRRVRVIGISEPIGESQIRCFIRLIQVNRNGIISIIHIPFVSNP